LLDLKNAVEDEHALDEFKIVYSQTSK